MLITGYLIAGGMLNNRMLNGGMHKDKMLNKAR